MDCGKIRKSNNDSSVLNVRKGKAVKGKGKLRVLPLAFNDSLGVASTPGTDIIYQI